MNQRSKRLIAVITAMLGMLLAAYGLLGFALATTMWRGAPKSALYITPMAYMVVVATGIGFIISGVIARRRFGGLAPTLSPPQEQVDARLHEPR